MKNFFASLLGTLVALMIFTVGGALLVVAFLGAIAAMGGGAKAIHVEDGSYLVFDLSANITDTPPSFDGANLAAAFSQDEDRTLQLRAVTRALRAAAQDDRIAGVALIGSFRPAGYGTGFAALSEVRAALSDFKASGKPIQAYLDNANTRDYYVASVATDLALDPYGMLAVPGLASEPMFYAGAFERFGIGVQVTRVGRFKSAVEPFIRKDLSPENREQLQKLLDDLWTDMRNAIADGRGITSQQFQALIDKGEGMHPTEAVANKLVSRLAYRDEIIAELKRKTGRTGKETYKQVSLPDYTKIMPDPGAPVRVAAKGGEVEKSSGAAGKRGRIAIVYAEGAIVDGEGQIGEVGGLNFARELRKLRQDNDVKAILLRVNSPGGSASASEHIQRELRLAREQGKTVVVSMGSYAASGGYWISTYSDRIFAEPNTITGSIGVFGVFFNVQKLANDLGVTWDIVKTGKFADTLTASRPQTPEELALTQKWVDWIYNEFITKVADSRKLDRARVQEIAQGRVWSGAEGLKLGLVDEIGGLDDALAYTAERAGLGVDYRVSEFPRKKELAEVVTEMIEKMQPSAARTQAGALTRFVDQIKEQAAKVEQFNDPRGVYLRLPFEINAK